MKKNSILSLLIVFSVLISCAFHLSVCAEETAPPETASVPSAEEASAQPIIEVTPAQPTAEPVVAPPATTQPVTNPTPEPAPAPMSSPPQPATNPAPKPAAAPAATAPPAANQTPSPVTVPAANPTSETDTTPAANSSPDFVAESTTDPSIDPVTETTAESSATSASMPAPESNTDAKDAENNTELVLSDPAASDKSDGDVPVATERAASGYSASGDTIQIDTESREDDTFSTDADRITSQNDIHAEGTEKPVTGTGLHAAETEMSAAEDNTNGGTYSITLRNRVYVDTSVDLTATFYLSILRSYIPDGLDLDWFKELFEEDGQFWTGSIPLQNNGTRSLQGIPSICPVIVNSILPTNDEYKDEEGDHEFLTSYIVDKTCKKDLPPVLNGESDCTGDIEFSFLRFPEQRPKKMYVVNDSDVTGNDPQELELTVLVDKECVFDYSVGSGKQSITLKPGETIIKLMPGEYGYISPKSGDLSDVKMIRTPANVNVTTGVSPVGNYDETSHEMELTTGSANTLGTDSAIYSLFRAEKPKTDSGTPKTDDDDPGKDPGTNPGNPDPGNDPKTTNPGITPENNPGTPDPGKDTPVSTSTNSAPNKNKKSPYTDRPSEDTAVSQKTPAAVTTSIQTDAVDTADRTPITMYILLMLAALVTATIIAAARTRQHCRR